MTQRLEFQVIDHGCDGESYFPGCGVAFSRFEYCATGIGDSAREAGEDALEQVHFSDSLPGALDMTIAGMDALESAIGELSAEDDTDPDPEDPNPEWHHYVSIRWRIVEGT